MNLSQQGSDAHGRAWPSAKGMPIEKQVCSLDLAKRLKPRSRSLQWYHANKGKAAATSKAYRQRTPEKQREWRRVANKRLRVAALNRYSNNDPKCACCGERTYEFLAIDHINGNGKEHRQQVGNSNIYNALRKEGYPEGYQVLCHNCNSAKGFYGRCPHINV